MAVTATPPAPWSSGSATPPTAGPPSPTPPNGRSATAPPAWRRNGPTFGPTGTHHSLAVAWQGLFYDLETGHSFNRARTLDHRLGRFLQRDPLGYVDGMSLYEYVGSGPTGFTDSMGARIPKTESQGMRIMTEGASRHRHLQRWRLLGREGRRGGDEGKGQGRGPGEGRGGDRGRGPGEGTVTYLLTSPPRGPGPGTVTYLWGRGHGAGDGAGDSHLFIDITAAPRHPAWPLPPTDPYVRVHLIAVPAAVDSLRTAIGAAHRRYTHPLSFREPWRGRAVYARN